LFSPPLRQRWPGLRTGRDSDAQRSKSSVEPINIDEGTSMTTVEFDVLIVGAGISGTTLACVLAKNGVTVGIIDAGSHPRFAVGESMIPYTSQLMKLVSKRYNFPELANLASHETMAKYVSNRCGEKKNFGFVHHGRGAPEETNQFVIPSLLSSESHIMREDVDEYLFHVAVRSGARPFLGQRVDHIDINDNGVAVRLDCGTEIRGRFVVDASGPGSPLVRQLNLREEPSRFVHSARGSYTHMLGVKPFATPATPPKSAWHDGTLHHIIDGGWLWVIPFDNSDRSASGLVSVGLSLETSTYGFAPRDAETEFREICARYPRIGEQFEHAIAIRPWLATGRMQSSTKDTVGARYCVTSHAAGFIDPLFSRGLTSSLEIVNILGWRLIEACRTDLFTEEKFAYVEEVEQGLLDANDALVRCAFTSFKTYDLWNAYFRIWALGAVLGTFRLQRAIAAFEDGGDEQAFRSLESKGIVGSPFPEHGGFNELAQLSIQICDKVRSGELDPEQAARQLFAALGSAAFVPPAFGFGDQQVRAYEPSPSRVLRTMAWSFGDTGGVGPLVRGALRGFAAEKARSKTRSHRGQRAATLKPDRTAALDTARRNK
jgi:tetracycline 7-halogenase / FADH2 O2-dependent halogenase